MRKLLFAILPCAAVLMSAGAAQASVEISTAATKNMSCSAGVCSPTAKNAVLNVNDLTNMLASADVKITTGAGAVTITVAAPFSWTSAHRLTLDAYYNVSFRAPVTVAGQGAVTITYNDGGTGGDLVFFPGAKLDFWDTSNSLVINGKNYLLFADIATLAKADLRGSFALTKNYDASIDGPYSEPPIFGSLSGTVEGLGHTIANLAIVSADCCGNYIGFISSIEQSGVVRDFGLTNVSISHNGSSKDSYNARGTLAGVNNGIIKASFATGTMTVDQYFNQVAANFGGLVSDNGGAIENSYTNVHLALPDGASSQLNIGGIAGGNGGTIDHSHAHGQLDILTGGFIYAGGLTGINVGVISNSHASGNVVAHRSGYVGGLVGENDGGVIQSSYATGSTATTDDTPPYYCYAASAGGLVGSIFPGSTIQNSYALGAAQSRGKYGCSGGITGEIYGYVGEEVSSIKTSYSIGKVSGSGEVGGFIGRGKKLGKLGNKKPPVIGDGYWDIDTSSSIQGIGNRQTSDQLGVTGLADAQLKSGLPAGFDPKIWGQKADINNGYPYLLANPPPQ